MRRLRGVRREFQQTPHSKEIGIRDPFTLLESSAFASLFLGCLI